MLPNRRCGGAVLWSAANATTVVAAALLASGAWNDESQTNAGPVHPTSNGASSKPSGSSGGHGRTHSGAHTPALTTGSSDTAAAAPCRAGTASASARETVWARGAGARRAGTAAVRASGAHAASCACISARARRSGVVSKCTRLVPTSRNDSSVLATGV